MHPGIANVQQALLDAGATGELRVFEEPARTAADAAALLGCPVGAIANSLVFDADGSAVLVLTSGAHRVDTSLVAELLGVSAVTRASPELVRRATGQVIGGVAPVGHPEPLRTLVDVDLELHHEVWAAAGHQHAVFRTSYDELLRITGGRAVRVSAD